MGKTKKIIFVLIAIVLSLGIFLARTKFTKAGQQSEYTKEISPFLGSIQVNISTTGTILPKNRLEIKPPVAGRVDNILIQEGQKVKTGQVLGWMSSTERAALLDSARGQGEDALKQWQEVYKAIPLIAPIDGEVIVSRMQPGQTVSTADAAIVLSDTLIVRAQVDETDIGKIKPGLKAKITLDAYPGQTIKAVVDHIYRESITTNNVTIYQVDLLPEDLPEFLRSGMNTSVDFLVEDKDNILLLPTQAITQRDNRYFVMVKDADGKTIQREISTGISDDKNIEITSGLSREDTVLIKGKKYTLPKSNQTGSNPFMPSRRPAQGQGQGR